MTDVLLSADGAAVLAPAVECAESIRSTFSPGFVSDDGALGVFSVTAMVLDPGVAAAHAAVWIAWAGGAVLLLVLLLAWRRVRRRARIAGEWYCGRCNYHLAGVHEALACPECGSRAARVRGRSPLRRVGPVLLLTAIAVGSLVAVSFCARAHVRAAGDSIMPLEGLTAPMDKLWRALGARGLPPWMMAHMGWVAAYDLTTGQRVWRVRAESVFSRAAPVAWRTERGLEVVAGLREREIVRLDARTGAELGRVSVPARGSATTLGETEVAHLAPMPDGTAVLLGVQDPNQSDAPVFWWDGTERQVSEQVATLESSARVLADGRTFFHGPWVRALEAGALLVGPDVRASGRLVRSGVALSVRRVRGGEVEASVTLPVVQYAALHASRDASVVLVEDLGPPLLVRTGHSPDAAGNGTGNGAGNGAVIGAGGGLSVERWSAVPAQGITTLVGVGVDATGEWALVRAVPAAGAEEAWVVSTRTHAVAARLSVPAGETILRGTLSQGGTVAAVVTLHNTRFEQRVRVYKGIAASTNDAGTPDAKAVTP